MRERTAPQCHAKTAHCADSRPSGVRAKTTRPGPVACRTLPGIARTIPAPPQRGGFLPRFACLLLILALVALPDAGAAAPQRAAPQPIG